MTSIRTTWDAAPLLRKARDGGYLLRILFLIVLGMLLARWLSGFEWWRGLNYDTYGLLLRFSQSPPTYPSWTAVVLIDDDDYWLGEWARRVPLKRSILAKLLRQIQLAKPRAIAIDVDLRAHVPDGRILTHPDYQGETKELFDTVIAIARTTPVVLPKTIGFDTTSGEFLIDADVFDRLALGPNVAAGYTRVPADLRYLALPTFVNGQRVSSLAATAAAFVEPKSVQEAHRKGRSEFPFSMFLRSSLYADATVHARDVLAGRPDALRKLSQKVVVIGGDWHKDAFGRGEATDSHWTPVGAMPGALIHANYIEALLAQRTFSPSYHWLHYVLDVLIALALVAVLVAARGTWKIAYLALLAIIVASISMIAFQNLGTIFDAVPALVLLAAHGGFETIAEWKTAYDEHKNCRGTS